MNHQTEETPKHQVDTFSMILGLTYCVLTAVMWWYTCEDKYQPISGYKA